MSQLKIDHIPQQGYILDGGAVRMSKKHITTIMGLDKKRKLSKKQKFIVNRLRITADNISSAISKAQDELELLSDTIYWMDHVKSPDAKFDNKIIEKLSRPSHWLDVMKGI